MNTEFTELKARAQVLAAEWFTLDGSSEVMQVADEMAVREVERRCEREVGWRRAKVRVRVGGLWVSGVWHGDTVRRLEVLLRRQPEEGKGEERKQKVVETPVFLPLPSQIP